MTEVVPRTIASWIPSQGSIPASRNSTNVPWNPFGVGTLRTYAKTNALSAHMIAGFRIAQNGPAKLPAYRAARSRRSSWESRKTLFFNELASLGRRETGLKWRRGRAILTGQRP